jgi:hypothetical protein
MADRQSGPKRNGASSTQLRAVYEAMRIIAEDDRARGAPHDTAVHCDACGRDRPAAGSIDYAGTRLCNGCATDYEVLRISGQVSGLADYLASHPTGASAAV